MSLFSLFILIGVIYGFIAILYLFAGKKQNNYLGAVILILIAYLGENILISERLNATTAHLIFITLPFLFLLGPFISIHLEKALLGSVKSKGAWIRYLLPLIVLAYMIPFYLSSVEAKISYFEAFKAISTNQEAFKINIIYFLFQVQTALYLFQTIRKIEQTLPGNLKRLNFYLKSTGIVFTAMALLQLSFYSSIKTFTLFNNLMITILIMLVIVAPWIRSQNLKKATFP